MAKTVTKPATKPAAEPVVNKTAFDPAKIKKIGDIVLPSISIKAMKEGDRLYIRAESEITKVEQTDEKTGKVKVDKDTGEVALLPVLIVVNLTTGQRGQMVIPAIVYRGFISAGTLVGRQFELTKGRSLGTGKANMWEVTEFN